MVDESVMTGESRPKVKKEGDSLISGTRNITAMLTAVILRRQNDSALVRLIASVSSAVTDRVSPTYVRSAMKCFAPAMIAIACASFCCTLIWNNNDAVILGTINRACERAVAVLVAACPCALGLAVPSTVMAAVGGFSNLHSIQCPAKHSPDAGLARGVIIKGRFETMETMSRITHVVLDKTGTLTKGQPSVSRLRLLDPLHKMTTDHLMLLCAAERDSHLSHPVGRAVFQWAFSQLDSESSSRVGSGQRTYPTTPEVEFPVNCSALGKITGMKCI